MLDKFASHGAVLLDLLGRPEGDAPLLPAGLAGSLLGGFVVYVLPAMIRWPSASALGRVGCLMLALLGVGLGLLGAQQTLAAYGLI